MTSKLAALTAIATFAACGGNMMATEGQNNAGNGDGEMICTGDIDTGLVCRPANDLWDCDALPNAAKKCVRADFGAPGGGGDWVCTHDEFTVTCTKPSPDAVGGGGWTCTDKDGQKTCVSSTNPNGSGSGSGSGSAGGSSGGSGATPPGGDTPGGGAGNWVCVSDDVQTVCTSTDDNNVPPGGGSWNCTIDQEFTITCDETTPSTPNTPTLPTGGSSPAGGGELTCYCPIGSGKTNSLGSGPIATVITRDETYGGKAALYAQVTFSTRFNDNTYGSNSSPCWGETNKGLHEFKQLVGSDAAELNFHDCNGDRKLGARIDYISEASTSSGYDSLCVSGGDGQMTSGPASAVLGCQTSLDVNFNTHGYVLTDNSPTFDNYNPTAGYPNWIYEVWYGVWVDKAVFGGAGACKVSIDYVHASPACGGANSIEVEPCPC